MYLNFFIIYKSFRMVVFGDNRCCYCTDGCIGNRISAKLTVVCLVEISTNIQYLHSSHNRGKSYLHEAGMVET
jgi:hypothetical protein